MKVNFHFTLVGKTNQWKKFIKDKRDNFTNADNLDYVCGLVEEQFGSRPTFVDNEKMLRDDALTYPKCFSAGWLVSQDKVPTELVIIAHGDTMELANKNILESLKHINWDTLAKKI